MSVLHQPKPARRLLFPAFALLGLVVFAPALFGAPRHKTWDWGPHHALTRALARGLATGHVPRYLVGVSTGDSPYEMYPLLTYGLAAGLTLLTGDEANAPAVLALMAVVCHILIATLIARLAAQFAPLPLAWGVGLAAFFDVGSFESGAAQTVLEAGLLHGALAQCLLLGALAAVLGILSNGPRLGHVARLWCLSGLAAAAHPASLLFLAPLLLILVVGAAVAKRREPLRCLAAALHLGIGVLLAALVWMPFAHRVLSYGIHVASPAAPLTAALLEFGALRSPPTSWPLLLAVGYLGLFPALLCRRAAPMLVAGQTSLLLLAFSELPHRLLFDWLPRTFARWQCFRFLTLARPMVFVLAALCLGWAWSACRRRVAWLAPGRLAPAVSLALFLAACVAFESADFPTGLKRLRSLARSEVPDPTGFAGLLAWAREQRAAPATGQVARVLWRGPENAGYHLSAEAGLPAFGLTDAVGIMLRERIEDNQTESLRRFNVRWLVAFGQAPGRGDEGSERRFGSYVVRELPEWDGRLARIEKGSGSVRVAALQDERIEVELTDTEAPALVALGLGYYPRWRARSEDGTAIPVFALPATPGGSVRVVAAWIPPGRTTFIADGALDSDRAGFAPAAAGLACAALSVVSAWRLRSRPTARRILRVLSPWRLRLGAAVLLLGLVTATLALAGTRRSVDPALRLVPGWRPDAIIEARAPDGDWRPCRFDWLRRDFSCLDLGRIGDGVAFIVRDHPSSTPFLTPGIVARPDQNRVEYRVRVTRSLEGRHWAATWGLGGAGLVCGEQALRLERRKQAVEIPAGAPAVACELSLRTRGRTAQGATLVRAEAIDFDRTRDVPWAPEQPPQAVAGLTKRR